MILIMLLFFIPVVLGDMETINMVVSFVSHDERATSVLTPYLCWSQCQVNQLAKSLAGSGVNMAQSMQPNRTEYELHHLLIVVDLSCPGVEELLVQANEQSMFKSPYRWLVLDENEEVNWEAFGKLDVLVDSEFVIARRTDFGFSYTEAYKISNKFEITYTPRGIWRPKNSNKTIEYPEQSQYENMNDTNIALRQPNAKIVVNYKSVFSCKNGIIEDFRETKALAIRRRDLKGHVITMVNVVTDSNETYKHLEDRLFLHHDSITKCSNAVVRICLQMLNATQEDLFTNTWGYRDANGNWQGIIDHLLKKRADLGTQSIFTLERSHYIEYIAMVSPTSVRFVFREPPLAYLSNIFTLPFTGAVWMAIFICVLGCSVFLYITSKWEATMGMHPLQLDGSWADVLILIIGAVLQQGCTLEPRHAAGRCVTLLVFLALTILYAAYSANIVVLLRAPSSSVRSLSDILNSPLKLGASDFEYNRYFFKKLNEPIRKAIYDKKIAPKGKKANFYSMKEGVEKIRNGLFAFHMELNPGYRLIQETFLESEKCDLVEIDYINEIDPWVPGQRRGPFKDMFKINFHRIRETGVQANLRSRLTVPRPKCSGTVSTFSSVGITDMYPAMLATLYGILLAPVVLLFEIVYKRLLLMRQRAKERRQRHSSSSLVLPATRPLYYTN